LKQTIQMTTMALLQFSTSLDQDYADLASDYGGDPEEFEFDESIITFAHSVRFDDVVSYADPPEHFDDENVDPPMTYHEMVEIFEKSHAARSRLRNSMNAPTGRAIQPSRDPAANDDLDEHSLEMLDLDKKLFIAFINGIHVSFESSYKDEVQLRARQVRNGYIHNPFFESKSAPGRYLDDALFHVVGMFRNVVTEEELRELAFYCTANQSPASRTYRFSGYHSQLTILLSKIERILTDKLTAGKVSFDKDELSFFAGGILYALDHGYFTR